MVKERKSATARGMISAKDIISDFGITYQTVNHYTDVGLFPILVKRGNVRFYDKQVVQKRLKKIRELAQEGYSLRLIRKQVAGI